MSCVNQYRKVTLAEVILARIRGCSLLEGHIRSDGVVLDVGVDPLIDRLRRRSWATKGLPVVRYLAMLGEARELVRYLARLLATLRRTLDTRRSKTGLDLPIPGRHWSL